MLAFLWNEKGGAFRDLYAYDADQKRLTRLTDPKLVKDPINVSDEEQDAHERTGLLPQLGLGSLLTFPKTANGWYSATKAIFTSRKRAAEPRCSG